MLLTYYLGGITLISPDEHKVTISLGSFGKSSIYDLEVGDKLLSI